MDKKEAKSKVKSIFLNIDNDESGEITYSEFIAAMLSE